MPVGQQAVVGRAQEVCRSTSGLGHSGWKQAGPAPSLVHLVLLGPRQAVLCSSRTFLLAASSTVEYPLQLLHSPQAPAVKRPGAMAAAHHPLQVLFCPLPSWAGGLVAAAFSVLGILIPLSLCGGLLWCLSPSVSGSPVGTLPAPEPHSQAQGP